MKTAHQGVPVAALPGAGQRDWLSRVAQSVGQAAPQVIPPADNRGYVPSQPASYPAQRAAPAQASVRPEAGAGLDGWLMDRLFGR